MATTHIANQIPLYNHHQDKFILPSHALDQTAALLRIGKGLLKAYVVSPDFAEGSTCDEDLANDLHLLLDAAENSINYVIYNAQDYKLYVIYNAQDYKLDETFISKPKIPTNKTYSDLYKY